MSVASSRPYANLHLAPDRKSCQHPTTQFFTGRMPFLQPNHQHQSTKGNNRCIEQTTKCKRRCVFKTFEALNTGKPNTSISLWRQYLAVAMSHYISNRNTKQQKQYGEWQLISLMDRLANRMAQFLTDKYQIWALQRQMMRGTVHRFCLF